MNDAIDVVRAFDALKPLLSTMRVLAWDVDATLGDSDGWENGTLANYCYMPTMLQHLLAHLKRQGIANVVVSRNLHFCAATLLPSARRQALDMHFSAVVPCASDRMSVSKAVLVARHVGCKPEDVVLIDDQVDECKAAAADGAVALCVKRGPALMVIPRAQFEILYKDKETGKVRRTAV
jgi:methionine salvage enolase-phosphatase E1